MIMMNIENLKKKYDVKGGIEDILERLRKIYLPAEKKIPEATCGFMPDLSYVLMLRERLETLKNAVSRTVFDKMKKSLSDAKISELEDEQELMEHIHSKVVLEVYSCLKKVKPEDMELLTAFIAAANYTPVDIKPGDLLDISNVDYFEEAFPERCNEKSRHNTVYRISQKPYHIIYFDGVKEQELILKGYCSIFRYKSEG